MAPERGVVVDGEVGGELVRERVRVEMGLFDILYW